MLSKVEALLKENSLLSQEAEKIMLSEQKSAKAKLAARKRECEAEEAAKIRGEMAGQRKEKLIAEWKKIVNPIYELIPRVNKNLKMMVRESRSFKALLDKLADGEELTIWAGVSSFHYPTVGVVSIVVDLENHEIRVGDSDYYCGLRVDKNTSKKDDCTVIHTMFLPREFVGKLIAVLERLATPEGTIAYLSDNLPYMQEKNSELYEFYLHHRSGEKCPYRSSADYGD